MAAPYRILVLGGYGVFGSRIARRLALTDGCHVTIGGRDIKSAETFCKSMNHEIAQTAALNSSSVNAVGIDCTDQASLQHILQQHSIDCVIHTAGPFQSHADYGTARTILDAGVNYIDIADARRYICDFPVALDELAKRNKVVAVTGASSVPGISTSVLDHLITKAAGTAGGGGGAGAAQSQLPASPPEAGTLTGTGKGSDSARAPLHKYKYPIPPGIKVHSIDVGINPGNQTPRGIATVKSILSYCGKPITVMQDGKWTHKLGWAPSDMIQRVYPLKHTPKRFLVSCDVADLELFPDYYGCHTVHFRAGLELAFLTVSTSLMSLLVHPIKVVRNLAVYGRPLAKMSLWVRRLGSTAGAMHVDLVYSKDADKQQPQPLYKRTYYLCADSGVDNPELLNTPGCTSGPEIPCTPAVIIAQKLAAAAATSTTTTDPTAVATSPQAGYAPGAYPCLSLFSVQDALASLRQTCGDRIWAVEEDEQRL